MLDTDPKRDPWGYRNELSANLEAIANYISSITFSESAMFYNHNSAKYSKKVASRLRKVDKLIDKFEKDLMKIKLEDISL